MMAENVSIYDEDTIDWIVREKYADHVKTAARSMKRRGPEYCQGGEGAGKDNLWDEFCYQVQETKSKLWSLHEEFAEEICNRIVKTLSAPEISLLWFRTQRFREELRDGNDITRVPSVPELQPLVAAEVYSGLLVLAKNAEPPNYTVGQFQFSDDNDPKYPPTSCRGLAAGPSRAESFKEGFRLTVDRRSLLVEVTDYHSRPLTLNEDQLKQLGLAILLST